MIAGFVCAVWSWFGKQQGLLDPSGPVYCQFARGLLAWGYDWAVLERARRVDRFGLKAFEELYDA
eukprot:11171036-Lingulodinium_polyedra.AAC.1